MLIDRLQALGALFHIIFFTASSCSARDLLGDVQLSAPEFAAARAAPALPLVARVRPEAVIQQRWAKFEWNTSESTQTLLDLSADDPMTLNLFDQVKPVISAIHQTKNDDGIWEIDTELSLTASDGTLLGAGSPFNTGHLLLSMDDDGTHAVGHAQVGIRRFRLEGRLDAIEITEIDTDAYPHEIPVEVEDSVHEGNASTSSSASSVDLMQSVPIRVLVLMESSICTSSLATYRSYYQSHMRSVWSKYGVGIDLFVECITKPAGNDISSDLEWTRTNGGVAGLRSTHNADIVALIVPSSSDDSCGIAYLPDLPLTSWHRAWGYSVTVEDCAVDTFTLAHEIGHNFGLRHDREVDTTNLGCQYGAKVSEFDWGFTRWRTIMSYSDGCFWGCPRIDHYSNGGEYGDACQSNSVGENNAMFLMSGAPIVATWRD